MRYLSRQPSTSAQSRRPQTDWCQLRVFIHPIVAYRRTESTPTEYPLSVTSSRPRERVRRLLEGGVKKRRLPDQPANDSFTLGLFLRVEGIAGGPVIADNICEVGWRYFRALIEEVANDPRPTQEEWQQQRRQG